MQRSIIYDVDYEPPFAHASVCSTLRCVLGISAIAAEFSSGSIAAPSACFVGLISPMLGRRGRIPSRSCMWDRSVKTSSSLYSQNPGQVAIWQIFMQKMNMSQHIPSPRSRVRLPRASGPSYLQDMRQPGAHWHLPETGSERRRGGGRGEGERAARARERV